MNAYQTWDIMPEGTSFTVNFPFKVVEYEAGNCLSGVWTLTKLPILCLLKFQEEDPALVIPLHARDAVLDAVASSTENPNRYLLTRGDVRKILEWIEREGMPLQIEDRKQLVAPHL
jgi:hypothetical protein